MKKEEQRRKAGAKIKLKGKDEGEKDLLHQGSHQGAMSLDEENKL